MSTFKKASLALFFILCSTSCRTTQPQASSSKHDAGRFLNSADSTLWGNFSEADYEALQAKAYSSKMLPVDHELTKRLQFWADTIRAKMIKIMPQVASVPAPQIRILKSDSVNAFAQAVNTAVIADIATPTVVTEVIPNGKQIVLGKECSSYCPEFNGDLEAKRTLVEARQKRVNKDCKVQTNEGILQLSESCLAPPGAEYKGARRFNRYNTPQVLNYVSVLSESIKKMSESDIVVTLAHELGHYYMAHPVYSEFQDPAVPYNYLYIKSDRVNAGKPTPLAPDDPNYAFVKQFDETVDFSYPAFEGQKYSTVLDLAIARSVANGLNRGGIVDRCVTGTDLMVCLNFGYEVSRPALALEEWASHYKGGLLSAEAVAGGRDLVLKFEAALAKHSSILRASDLSDIQKCLAEDIGRSAPSAVFSGEKDETVTSFLPAYAGLAEGAIKENPQAVAKLTQTVADKGLGFYTAEQEADDIATEVVYDLGFDPDLIVKNWMHFVDRSSISQSKKDACKANYASGFKSPVWIGLSTEPHHGDCYRAYNTFNEIKLHHDFFEKNKVAKKPEAPGRNWDDLVAEMKSKSFVSLPGK